MAVGCRAGAGPALGSGGWSASLGTACSATCAGIDVGGAASGSKAFSDTSG